MAKKIKNALMLRKLHASWHKALKHFIPLGGFSAHNRVILYHTGDEAFLAIHEAISGAKTSIYVETYILAGDRLGIWLQEALLAARQRGVEIAVLYDHVGSAGLSHSFLKPMITAGIKVVAFNPIWPWRRRGPLLFRDHRKIIVVDEKLAFCGSMNISADYAGPLYGNDRFRDSLARIEGPAVADLLAITLESIAEAEFDKYPEALQEVTVTAHKRFLLKRFFTRLFHRDNAIDPYLYSNETLIQVLRSNVRRNLSHIQRSMEESVNRAVKYCYFTTPYFLPQEGLRKAIINAKRRGVDVRILTAGISDVPLMRYASRHVYTSFLQQGIRIYEMTKKTLHAKLATIDGVYASVGSYNLDHWSARRNLEVNVAIIDRGVALEMKEQFSKDLELAQEVKKEQFFARSFLRKFLCFLAYSLFRL